MKLSLTSINNRVKSYLARTLSNIQIKHKIPVNNSYVYLHDSCFLDAYKAETFMVDWINSIGGGVVYDIGANVGSYSILLAKKCKVYAMEPSIKTLNILQKNLVSNNVFDKVTILPFAVSDSCKIQKYGHYAAVVSIDARGYTEDSKYFTDRKMTQTHDLLSFDLDTLVKLFNLPYPDYIKIDVDGAELNVLKGAKETMKHAKAMIVEINDKEALNLLKDFSVTRLTSYDNGHDYYLCKNKQVK